MRILALVLVAAAACGPSVSPPPSPTATLETVASPTTSLAPARLLPTPVPTPPTPRPSVRIGPPVARAPVPDVGVLVVRDAFGTLYRYDGASATVERLTALGAWSVLRQTAAGVYEVGLQGGGIFVPWSGETRTVGCDGVIVAVSAAGACASRTHGPDGGLLVRYPGAPSRRILPNDWGAGFAAWDPSSRRLALTRTVDTRCMRCPNALYVIEADGTPRLLYDTRIDDTHTMTRGAVAGMLWSPSGDLIATTFSTGCAGCDSRAGRALLLIDPQTAAATDLGTTPGSTADIAWSPRGDIAFVAGTLDDITHSLLRIRLADGAERDLDARSAGPTFDAAGERLGWTRADGTAQILDLRSGTRSTVGCGDRSVVGIRFGADADAVLLLCRLPDRDLDRYEIHYVARGSDSIVLEQLAGTLAYFIGPDFLDLVAWSKGVPRIF